MRGNKVTISFYFKVVMYLFYYVLLFVINNIYFFVWFELKEHSALFEDHIENVVHC